MLYNTIKNILKPFLKIFFRVKVTGIENIPKESGCIVCSNHFHWLDPVVVACFTKRQVHFMAKKELFKNVILGNFLKKLGTFPVNRGNADITAVKNAIRIVRKNKVLGIFPEGTRVKTGEVSNVEPGIAMIAIKGKAQIIPIGISGDYKLGSTLVINIGQAISLEDYYGKKTTMKDFDQISEEVMKEVRNLIEDVQS